MKTTAYLLGLLASSTRVVALGSSCSAALGSGSAAAGDPYWMKNIVRQGTSAFNPNPGSYKVFRDVTAAPYLAKGDGMTDDTDAINRAISDGTRCGNLTCQSSTVEPALVYFPSGNYLITKPILPYYYTALVGDAKNPPRITGRGDFSGIALIDADVYTGGQAPAGGWNCPSSDTEWYCPVNNFFRSIRNFILDTTQIPASEFGTGIHWQVGQATSLININFQLSTASGNKHQGIFMENGSGGFMADLTINGGAFGLWISNQQFTIQNVKITNSDTAIFQQWNWGFTFKNIDISGCRIGFGLNTDGQTEATQSAGSVTILDSSISASVAAVQTNTDQSTKLGGAVVLQNVNLDGSPVGVVDGANHVFLTGGGTVNQFILGNEYSGTKTTPTYNTAATPGPDLPSQLLDASSGNNGVFFRTRPQYEAFAVSQFASAKSNGVVCDGKTDDTTNLQNFINKFWGCKILYLDAGTCKVTNTIVIPTGSIVVGEFWTTILASGANFADGSNPRPVLQVGNPGDKGGVELSDIVVSTVGGSAGAIAIEWNPTGDAGKVGMWDVHVRIGGAVGTNIQISQCPTTSTATSCVGAFLGLHILGSGYFENVWVWTADHDLDDPGQGKINSFNARGIFVDHAPGPVWLIGTASEHAALYQYSIVESQFVYAGMIQTETPYYQPTPAPPSPFSIKSDWDDPSFANSGSAWALNIASSSNVYVYGAGLYSFFVSYSQDCKPTVNCQKSLVLVDNASAAVFIYSLSTIGATTMLTVGNTDVINHADNVDGLQSTASKWAAAITTPPTPPKPCTLVQGWVKNWVNYIMNNYWENSAGTITNPIGCGCFNTIPQAWEEPVTIEAVINWIWFTGDTNGQDLIPTQIADSFFLSWSGKVDHPTPAHFGSQHDDALWAALAWLKWYEFEQAHGGGSTDYLNAAKDMIDFAATDRNTTGLDCPGGVYWKANTDKGSKNTVTNGLFIAASAKYYLLTGNTAYRDQALDVWNWAKSVGLRGSDNLYNDGTVDNNGVCSNNAATEWTYNQGLFVYAAGQMALAFNDKSYITYGNATVAAVIESGKLETPGGAAGNILTETCDFGSCDNDQTTFKGIWMMHLQYFLDAANDPALTAIYSPWIGRQVRAITDNAQASSGDVGSVWPPGGKQQFGAEVIGMAISAGNLASKYGTMNSSFTC